MKNSVNRVTLMGSLGKDPEITTFESGKKKASFSIATNDYYTNDKGERIESTEWHRAIAWGKDAEYVESHLRKGKRVILEGKLTTHSYEKGEQTHYMTEVRCNTLQVIASADTAKE